MNKFYKIIGTKVVSEISRAHANAFIACLLAFYTSNAFSETLYASDILGYYINNTFITYDGTESISDNFIKSITRTQNTGIAGNGEVSFGIQSQLGFLKNVDSGLFATSVSISRTEMWGKQISLSLKKVQFDKNTGKALVTGSNNDNINFNIRCTNYGAECTALYNKFDKNADSTASSTQTVIDTADGMREFFDEFKKTTLSTKISTSTTDVDSITTYGPKTQRLTNISDGIDDNDAVTVSQLKSQSSNNYLSVNSAEDLASPTTSAQAIGAHSLALGEEAKVEGTGSVAIGYGSVVLTGEDNVLSVGSVNSKRRILHVADGIDASDAATVGQVSTIAKKSIVLKSEDQNIEVTSDSNDDKLNYKFKINANGSVQANNTGLISGGMLFNEVNIGNADGNIVKSAQTVGQNLKALDRQVYANSQKKVIAGENVSVAEKDGEFTVSVAGDGVVEAGNVGVVKGGAVWSALDSSLSSVRNAESLTSENIASWQKKLGGDVEEGDEGFVSGDKVDAALKNVFDNLDSSDNSDYGNAVKDQARKAVSVTAGENEFVKIQKSTNEHEDTYTISLTLADKINGSTAGLVTAKMVADEVLLESDGTIVKKANTTAVNIKKLDSSIATLQTNKLGLDLASLTLAGEEKIKSLAQSSFVLEDGNHISWNKATTGVLRLDVEDNGTVSESDTKLVTGKTVYEAIEAAKSDMAAGTVAVNFAKKDASNIEEANWRAKLGTKQGVVSVSTDNEGFITGRELAEEVKLTSDGSYVKKDKSVSTNLTALDTAVNDRVKLDFSNVNDWSSVAGAISLEQSADKRVLLSKIVNNDGTVSWSLGIATEQASADDQSKLITSGAVDSKLLSYAKADSTGLTTENIAAWRFKLGGGTIDSNSNGFVTGRSVYAELRPSSDGQFVLRTATTADNLLALDTGLNKVTKEIYGNSSSTLLLAKNDLSNLTSTGESKIQNISRKTITDMVPSDGFIEISLEGNLSVKATDAIGNEDGADNKLVTSKAVYEALNGQNGIATDISRKADKDASNLEANEISAWRSKLGGGAVAAGDQGFVTGESIHSELRPDDGSFVRKNETTARNLTSLDQAMTSFSIAEGVQKDKWLAAFSGEITEALPEGNNPKGNGFVTGSSLYNYATPALLTGGKSYAVISRDNSVAGNLTALDAAVGAMQQGQLSDATQSTISNLILNSIKGSDLIDVSQDTMAKTLTISGKKGDVSEGNAGLVTGGQVMAAIKSNAIDADYVNNAVSNAICNDQQVQQAISNILAQSDQINNAVKQAFTTMSDETVNKIAEHVKANGTIAANETQAVSGKTVHDYLHGDKVGLGKGVAVFGVDSIAIGSGSSVAGSSSIVVGTGGEVSGNNSGIFGDPSFVGANNAYAFGNNNRIELGANRSFAFGNENKIAENSEGNFVFGNTNSVATNVTNTFVLGNNVNVSQGVKNAVVLGAGAVAVSNAVSVGSAGNERRIVNVAAGDVAPDSTDAVNGGQLYATQAAIVQSMEQTNRSIHQVERKLHKEINRAAANSAAMAALQPLGLDEDHQWSSAAGVGTYGGEQAVAVGLFYKPSENFMVSLGGSTTTNGNAMGNLGISYRFGAPGTYKKTSVSELNGKVLALTNHNRSLEAQLRSAQSREENMARAVVQSRAEIENLREELEMLKVALGFKVKAKKSPQNAAKRRKARSK